MRFIPPRDEMAISETRVHLHPSIWRFSLIGLSVMLAKLLQFRLLAESTRNWAMTAWVTSAAA